MADVMVALATETVIGTCLIGTGVLLVARSGQVAGSAQAGVAWLVARRMPVVRLTKPARRAARAVWVLLLAVCWPATGHHRGRRAVTS